MCFHSGSWVCIKSWAKETVDCRKTIWTCAGTIAVQHGGTDRFVQSVASWIHNNRPLREIGACSGISPATVPEFKFAAGMWIPL